MICCGIVAIVAATIFQNALKVFVTTKFIIVTTKLQLILQDDCHDKLINVVKTFQ